MKRRTTQRPAGRTSRLHGACALLIASAMAASTTAVATTAAGADSAARATAPATARTAGDARARTAGTAIPREPATEATMDAATLAHSLDRLASTARVLYIAAHPDDENTRLLAWLALGRHVEAAYLSMTRGGGGQNLIGTEQDVLLDVVRTQELLAARHMDGASQRFTRMRDFGFSKTPDETLSIWGHDEALADVVWAIRTFQPDVVVSRFDEKPPNHGHHTASAILSREAFAAAADPSRFPEQLTLGATPWQATRLLLNVPTWREEPPPADALPVDIGAYDARLGLEYGELAARSRSQHKSQGFGAAPQRGPLVERFVTVAGSAPTRDILDGVDESWRRFGDAGEAFGVALHRARESLERDRPERALPDLLEAHRMADALPAADPRVRDARASLDAILAAAAGLFVRATAPVPGAVPASRVEVRVEVVQRRPAAVRVLGVEIVAPSRAGGAAQGVAGAAQGAAGDVQDAAPSEARAASASDLVARSAVLTSTSRTVDLEVGAPHTIELDAALPAALPVSVPYWLAEPSLAGRQVLADPTLTGRPEGPPALAALVTVEVDGARLHLEVPVVHVWVDGVHGERTTSFLVVPPATVTPVRAAFLAVGGRAAEVVLDVRASADDVRGHVHLELPAGWKSEPASVDVALARRGDSAAVRLRVTPPPGGEAATLTPVFSGGAAKRAWSIREDRIDYAHIPVQVVLRPASLRVVPVEIALPAGRIGFIPGPGDTVAADLAQAGLALDIVGDEAVRAGDFTAYDVLLTGVRAWNTNAALRGARVALMRWVEGGGTLVVQYVTNSRVAPLDIDIGPYPFTIERGRVTDETAAMTFLDAADPLLTTPNRLGDADFAGWVQERGLYYAETWDPRYRTVLAGADPGEEALEGGILVADHGRGRYVYTGLAFFRQLPAGVPGAYRLLANLLAPRPR